MSKPNKSAELCKHVFIWSILLFSFFPMYVMLNISVKNNKQFSQSPFMPLPPSGLVETMDKTTVSEDDWDPARVAKAREAREEGQALPEARVSTPATWHWENWQKGWDTVKHYIFNTVFVAVTAVFLTLAFTLPAAYFFARYQMPGGKFLWYFFLLLMLMPGVANLIPLFMLLKHLNLLNSLWALVIVGVAGGQVMQIYILRNFIEEIPKDLFDAAEVDGANPLQQIFNIVLPMSGSIVSTLAILQFLSTWNDFILAYVVIRDDSLLTLAAGLLKLDGEYVKQWGEMMAGYSIASLPLVVIFIFTMRLFVKGLASGAVKG
jgi:ABC-type glycerol-3-phosphate transport system permease component